MTTTESGQAARIAEVVETSSTAFTAQCYELYGAPPLGSLVRAGDPPVYAVVRNVVTGALDPGRRVLARGAGEPDEDAVYRSHPQLSRLLATHIEALVLGHGEGAGLRHALPPAPPRIHAFVFCCTDAEVARFTEGLGFLHLLVSSGVPAVDEVMAACLRSSAASQPDPRAFLVRAGRGLAAELAGDVGRLNAILRSLT